MFLESGEVQEWHSRAASLGGDTRFDYGVSTIVHLLSNN